MSLMEDAKASTSPEKPRNSSIRCSLRETCVFLKLQTKKSSEDAGRAQMAAIRWENGLKPGVVCHVQSIYCIHSHCIRAVSTWGQKPCSIATQMF